MEHSIIKNNNLTKINILHKDIILTHSINLNANLISVEFDDLYTYDIFKCIKSFRMNNPALKYNID